MVDEKQYPVAAALKKATSPTFGIFDTEADYFIYLFSASWCGPCHRAMPKILEEYENMKGKGIDIILMGEDKTPEAAQRYRVQYDMPFYTILRTDALEAKIPGVDKRRSGGIPNCMVIDRYGRVIAEMHPLNLLPKWKALTIDKGAPEPPAETEK